MESYRNTLSLGKPISTGYAVFANLFRFVFERKIKMDLTVFIVFAVLGNYCFIDGCRSKETSVKINVNHNSDGSSKIRDEVSKRNSKEISSEYYDTLGTDTNPMYQASMIIPYSYPSPGVYFPVPATMNSGYYQGNEMLQSQYPQVVYPQPSQFQPINQPTIGQPENTQFTSTISNGQVQQTSPTVDFNSPVATTQTDGRPVNLQPNVGIPLTTVSDPSSFQQNFGKPLDNPCRNKLCRPGTKCVVRRNPNCPRCPLISVCADPCATVRCASGHVCKAEVGSCGTPFCEPRAICKDLCEGVACPGNQTCSLISLPCTTSCDPVPICGRDPCEEMVCPLGQGCYLQEQFCSKPPCQVEPVCRDPCRDVTCAPGEFCYTEDVQCIKAPCNPIPYCKNPCAAVLCPVGQQCVLEQAFCIRTPCNPIATCKTV